MNTTTTTTRSDLTGKVIDVVTDWLADLRERSIEWAYRLDGQPAGETIAAAEATLLDIERETGALMDAMLRIGYGCRDGAAQNELDDLLLAVLGSLSGAEGLAGALAAAGSGVAA